MVISDRAMQWLRWVVAASLTASVAWAVAATRHWPLVGDAPLLHYVAFLIDHGKIPYRDIIEMDLPGTYLLQWLAIHVLGPGAAGWRLFDLGLVAVALAAMLAITWPEDKLAGFFAGTMFALIHFRDGPTHTGQRDLMMTVTALIACAFLFEAVRRHSVGAAAASGLFLGAAATIKPSGIFFLLLIALLWMQLRRTRVPAMRYVAASLVGYALPLLAVAVYLTAHHALGPFFAIMRGIGAYHASLGRPPFLTLLVGSFPSVLLAVAIPALPLFFARKLWRHWHGQVILVCIAIGAASYITQGKGFPYHRYPLEAFLLLLCAQLLFAALRSTDWRLPVAALGLLAGALFLAPASASIASHYDWRDQEFEQMLTADLNALGGASLDLKVQCLEMAAECHTTLYDMKLVEATGYMYDCYMFQPTQTPLSLQYRADFWAAIHRNPPRVFVVTDQECFKLDRNFGLASRWPLFREYLDTEYTLAATRTPPHKLGWWRHPAVPFSYQLYVRKERSGDAR